MMQEAINMVTERMHHGNKSKVWTLSKYIVSAETAGIKIQKSRVFLCTSRASCYREITTNYNKLARDPITRDTWTCTGFGKEFGNLVQGDDRTGTLGTNVIFVMDHDQISKIPAVWTVTYTRIVMDFRPQKNRPKQGFYHCKGKHTRIS